MRPGVVLALLLLAFSGCASAPPKVPDVIIQDYAFAPQNLTAKMGQEVLWRNDEHMDGHTVTSLNGTELGSDALGPGDVYRHTFTAFGTYAYYCKPHPWMRGNVTVIA